MSMELLTVDEAAQLLRVAPVTVRRYIASGRLRALRVGRGLRISKAEVERLPKAVEPRRRRKLPKGKLFTFDDALWNIVGMFDGPPTDIATQKDAFLAEAYGDLHDGK